MRSTAILRLFGTALRAWWDDDAPRLGASLSYYTLCAIAPILLVATAIAGMVFGVNVLVSIVVTTALFALLYRFLPDVHLRWRDVATLHPASFAERDVDALGHAT